MKCHVRGATIGGGPVGIQRPTGEVRIGSGVAAGGGVIGASRVMAAAQADTWVNPGSAAVWPPGSSWFQSGAWLPTGEVWAMPLPISR
jgi:hypothetical protein